MIPHERSLVEKYQGKPFQLLGVNAGEEPKDVKNYTLQHGMSWPSWLDEDLTYFKKWRVKGLPTVFVVDAKGSIRFGWEGDPGRYLDDAVGYLLEEMAKKS